MYKDKNELYKDVALEVTIDAKRGAKNQEIKTHATFYSYDVQSGLIKINIKKDSKPLPLPNGTEVLISAVKLDLPQQKMVFTGDIVDNNNGIAHWIIPDELRGYKGAIRAGVFVKLPNDQRLHGGYFKFNMGISEIDENLVPFEENYWQGWHDFQEEAEQEWNAWKAIRDDTWKKQEKDYFDWKQEQENKQTDYENKTDKRWNNWKNQQEKAQSDFESNFVFWKSEQEEEQTGFESDFADWKTTQETKQTNFESDTNKTISGINTKVDTAQSKVIDLEKNLDVEQKNYFSVTAWENNASTDVVDNYLPAVKLKLEGNTQYTLSTNIPMYDESSDLNSVFFATSDVGRVSSDRNGVTIDKPRTITTNDDGGVVIVMRDKDMTSGDWWIMLNKGETSAGWVPNADDLATKQETDNRLAGKANRSDLESKAEKSEITELNNKVKNYYDNLFETEVLYDGLEEDIGIYFDEKKTFTIDQNKTVEKLIFWWSRNEINEGTRNYAFETTIVDGQTLRTLQKKESTMRVPFKPTETDTTSFKNIDFIKEGVKGSEKNRQSNIGGRDNRWMALRKFYVIYRKEVG